uniref:Protein kinase domain-containing protein n=1 Tax=Oryza meridionalis TaxID=40149 RepID=A0A0E0BW23_9ORYZ
MDSGGAPAICCCCGGGGGGAKNGLNRPDLQCSIPMALRHRVSLPAERIHRSSSPRLDPTLRRRGSVSTKASTSSLLLDHAVRRWKRRRISTPSLTLVELGVQYIRRYMTATDEQRFVIAPLTLLTFLAFKYWKTRIKIDAVEKFLRMQLMLGPTRYAYTDIIAMTSHFRDKLGQGGYGSVFKGVILPGDVHVAIKMLANYNCNGEEFISEVSTIGSIHHVNVVRLVGYCAEEMRRALILHFDIKPHNILLDSNFVPKVADFGLAKLYPQDNSFVPVSAARGTVGYIAPEMISRSFGVISSKSDVYSFGMLLLEMAGGRRNSKQDMSSSSQSYYPSWVYNQLVQQKMGEIANAFNMHELEKKLCVVGLHCIQMKSHDRPTMSEVIEMLEGDVGGLQLPSRPFFCDDEPLPLLVDSCRFSSELTEISEEDE